MKYLVKQKELDNYLAEQEQLSKTLGKDFDRDQAIVKFISEHGIAITDDRYAEQLKKLKQLPLVE